MRVKDGPAHDRPRERLLNLGAPALRTAELLAILIRTGRSGESALQAGERLAAAFDARPETLPCAGRGELKEIATSIGPTAYCQIMAGIELGRRIAATDNESKPTKIANNRDAADFCLQTFERLARDKKHEEFHIVTLDVKNRVIATHQISVGTLDASLVHPREVFRPAIKDAAAAVILVHNHPSGDPTPSKEDLVVTRRLEAAGQTLGIDVLDHIIVTTDQAHSIASREGEAPAEPRSLRPSNGRARLPPSRESLATNDK
jgi:DNA repair protein RadC